MNNSQLEALCAVVEEGGVTAAAERLFCVPSNVTKKIQELESEFGIALFYRERNRMVLTVEGREFYRRAKAYMALREQALMLIYDTEIVGEIYIGALDVALSHHLPLPLATYRAAHPNVRMRVMQGYSFMLEKKLHAGEVDIIFSNGPVEHPLISSAMAFQEQLLLVGATKEDIPELDLYVYPKACHCRHIIDQWLAINDIQPKRIIELESYPVMIAMINNGLGCAFIPGSYAQGLSSQDIIPADIYVLWRKGGMSSLIRELLVIMGIFQEGADSQTAKMLSKRSSEAE
jgi:DNA-binding transcriptional LysR family regulator